MRRFEERDPRSGIAGLDRAWPIGLADTSLRCAAPAGGLSSDLGRLVVHIEGSRSAFHIRLRKLVLVRKPGAKLHAIEKPVDVPT